MSERSRAGAEWVSAPIEIQSTPVAAQRPERLQGHAAARLQLARGRPPGRPRRAAATRPCCPAAGAARPPRAPARSPARCAPRPRACPPARAPPRARAATAAAIPPAAAMWFSLIRIASYSPARWLLAPPGRHRRLLQRAQPRGRLARVQHPRPRALHLARRARRHRGHARQVGEEVQRGALGAQQRACAALPPTSPARRPRATRPPRTRRSRPHVGVEQRERRLGRLQAVDHARAPSA